MTQAIIARIATQRAEDVRILANQAERAGIRILATNDGEHFASTPFDPTYLYRLTLTGCDCLYFACFGRCIHHALLLSELGLIEDVEPAAAALWADDDGAETWLHVEPMLITLTDAAAVVA